MKLRFKEKEKVIIKSLNDLINEGYVTPLDIEGVYKDSGSDYILFDTFPYFGNPAIITEIDTTDSGIPYFLNLGIWLPEFMLLPENNKQEEKENNIKKDEKPIQPVEVGLKKYINRYNGKPFGKGFLKLIEMDEKIAEFSNTAFGKLRKHELLYIANMLKERGFSNVDYGDFTQDLLAKHCYNIVKSLINA